MRVLAQPSRVLILVGVLLILALAVGVGGFFLLVQSHPGSDSSATRLAAELGWDQFVLAVLSGFLIVLFGLAAIEQVRVVRLSLNRKSDG